MKVLKLKNDSVLIIPSEIKRNVLKMVQELGLCNVKILTLGEVRKKFYFDYDDKAIYYLMEKYHYQLDVAKMYLSRLYEVGEEDFSSAKIKKVIDLKKELIKEKLLLFYPNFHQYLTKKKIILYGCQNCGGIDLKLINDLKTNYNIEVIEDDEVIYQHDCIYQFDTIEQEVVFVATKINQLVLQGIPFQKIKICGATGEYLGLIKRIFEWYHIPITFCDNYLYATKIGQDFLKRLDKDGKMALQYIEEHYSMKDSDILNLYNKIIQILNRYAWSDDYLKVKSFVVEEFKNTIIENDNIQDEVMMISGLASAEEDDYVFLLGFNQGDIPKTYKDESYFNDGLKQKLGLETTNECNQRIYRKWLGDIKHTNNLIITTKETSSLGVHYLSSLNDDLKLEVKQEKMNYNGSNLYNQLLLGEKIDAFIKYGEKNEDLELLYSNYKELSYGTFSSDFKGIDINRLKNYLNHKFTLSYSAMNTYYQCGFRYYLGNILRLNIFEETFYTILGNLFHYILSIAFDTGKDLKKEYTEYLSKLDYSFNSREKFFLNKLEKELDFIIQVINEQNEVNSLKNTYYEEKIVIDKSRDDMEITFKGFVDKMMVNDNKDVVSIIDYKTGNPDLNLNHIIYGLDLQLPVYVYLARKKFPNANIAGFYLQKILNNEISNDYKHTYDSLKKDKLKLQGYSNSDLSILEQFDSSYYESKMIKGMRTTSKGLASKKVLSQEKIEKLVEITEDKIEEAIDGILKGSFKINPKRIGMDNLGCKYCEFKDICFFKEKHIQNLKEYKNMEFLEDDMNDTEETN